MTRSLGKHAVSNDLIANTVTVDKRTSGATTANLPHTLQHRLPSIDVQTDQRPKGEEISDASDSEDDSCALVQLSSFSVRELAKIRHAVGHAAITSTVTSI
jgi:hypothetical protein